MGGQFGGGVVVVEVERIREEIFVVFKQNRMI